VIRDAAFLAGHATAQAVSRRLLTVEAWVRVHVGFVVDKVAMGQVFLPGLRFFPVSIIPPLLHIHLCISWGIDNGPVSGLVPQRHSLAPNTKEKSVNGSWSCYYSFSAERHRRGKNEYFFVVPSIPVCQSTVFNELKSPKEGITLSENFVSVSPELLAANTPCSKKFEVEISNSETRDFWKNMRPVFFKCFRSCRSSAELKNKHSNYTTWWTSIYKNHL
jgi:hypothetical protein